MADPLHIQFIYIFHHLNSFFVIKIRQGSTPEASLTIDFKGSESFLEKRLLHFDWSKESGKWRISQVQIPQTHIE